MKIKKERERSNKQSKLYVIHNLKAYTSKSQVQDYINKALLKSATFKLVLGNKDPNEEGIFFCEIPNDKKNKKELDIYHLIYANEDSEAGKYYNPFTLKFIEQYYNYMNNLGNYDVIQTIKERFIEKYEEIVEKGEKINMNSFENSNPNLIKLKNEKEIILKQCFIDELGFSNLKSNGFEPKYNVFQEDNKIKVRLEVPGHINIQSDIEEGGNYNIIKLSGKKKEDSKPEKLEDNIHNTREYGEFSLEIPISKDYILKREKPFYNKIDGLHMFEYNLCERPEIFTPLPEKEENY
jgi:HSP20 family molecular chaperone IbpA